jgi:protoporphyrin/coproporphyrin ferrochelatase
MNVPYDALLVVSFGGPEGMDEVMPFLKTVLQGRNIPEDRLAVVAHHYELFGGVSPLNGQNRALIAALRTELEKSGPNLPIYWGNRNWTPFLAETLQQMKLDGIKRALAFFTSAYSSYSGCRQYREDIQKAQAAVGTGAPEVDKLRVFYNHPRFIEPTVENVKRAWEQIPEERRATARVAFTAHSIPKAMAAGCSYENQLREVCQLVAENLNLQNWSLVYQSRSGPPSQPWLEPDILPHLSDLKAGGITDVVVAPVGFISDHMEVLYDLDTEARQHCETIGLNMIRAATVGTHPSFIRMIRELILERMDTQTTRRSLGTSGPSHDVCPMDCCLPGGSMPGRPGQTGR